MTPSPDADVERRPHSTSGWTVAVGAALVLAVVFGAVVATILTADSAPPPTPDTESPLGPVSGVSDEPLPDLELEPLFPGGERDRIALADYRGTPLVVNYWATWCAPCVEEMPDLEAVANQVGSGAAFLGINVRDDAESARAFAEELGIGYDLAVDPNGDAFAAVEAFGMPTTLLVDAEGVVVYRHTGLLDAEALRSLLNRHLGVELGV